MGVYSWRLPAPMLLGGGESLAAELAGAIGRTQLGGLFDMFIDTTSFDYVDTEDGEWLETADSRTIVMQMLEIRFGKDFAAPGDGTRIKDELENDDGDPVTPGFVIAETLRAMTILVDAGIISDVQATMTDERGNLLVDEAGRPVVKLFWRDLASGSPIDLVYAPFQG